MKLCTVELQKKIPELKNPWIKVPVLVTNIAFSFIYPYLWMRFRDEFWEPQFRGNDNQPIKPVVMKKIAAIRFLEFLFRRTYVKRDWFLEIQTVDCCFVSRYEYGWVDVVPIEHKLCASPNNHQ